MNTIGTAETDTGKIQSLRRVIRQRRANLVPAGIVEVSTAFSLKVGCLRNWWSDFGQGVGLAGG